MNEVNVEEAKPDISVSEVFRTVFGHPIEMIVKRWNWKSAFLSAFIRAPIYLSTYLANKDGWKAAIGAGAVEFCLRIFTAGTSGTLIQSFRRAKPVWLSGLICSAMLPVFAHTLEYIVHFVHELIVSMIYNSPINQTRKTSFFFSVMFSVLSVIFNLFAVRRGVLIVGKGEGQQSLWKDIKQMPFVVGEFLAFPFVWIWKFYNR